LIFFSFNSVWTIIFSMAYTMWIIDGAVHLLASVASSVIWLLVTTALWVCTNKRKWVSAILILTQGVASGMMYVTRIGGNCPRSHPISRFVANCRFVYNLFGKLSLTCRCRQSLTVEALGWGEFGLCILALITTCVWVRGTKRSYVST